MTQEVEAASEEGTAHLDAFGLDIEIGNEPLPGFDDEGSYDSDEPTPEEAQAPAGEDQPGAESPAAAPNVSELQARISESDSRAQNLERQLNQLTGMVAPLIQTLTGGTNSQAQQITREQLNDPDATIDHLIAYLDQHTQQQQAALLGAMQSTALRTNSEQRYRGLLSNDALGGEGRDFDSVRSRYIEPLYQQNPGLRQMIDQQFGQDPAIIEYGLAMLLKLNELHKDDPVKTYRAFHDFCEGKQNQDLVRKLDQTARRQADRVATTRSRESGPSALSKLRPGELARSSDEEFAQIERELGFSGGM